MKLIKLISLVFGLEFRQVTIDTSLRIRSSLIRKI